MYTIYNLLRIFLYIIIFIITIVNKKIRKFFKNRILQKIKLDKFKNEKIILIHMSSVGEFNLSVELIRKLILKNEKIIISIMTDTGYNAVKKEFGKEKNIEIILFPLDDYYVIRKMYLEYNIYKTIIIETEIWPNLYKISSKKGDLYIINGRMTDKKLKMYLRIKNIIKNTLNNAKKILVQSEQDKKRYEMLNIDKSKLKVYKNLKYSIKYEILSENKKKEYYKKVIEKNKKIIVCGSTRPNEEKIWLEVLKELKNKKENQNIINDSEYQLILVPRHIDRIEEIIKSIKEVFGVDYKYSLLSKIFMNENNKNMKKDIIDIENKNDILNLDNNIDTLESNKKTDIVIVDKMGVLRDFYQMADFVFVGGTLVDIGGHSILEPLYYGKIPIIGQYYQNIEDIVDEAKKMNYIKIVENKIDILEYLEKNKKIDTIDFFYKNNDIEKIIEEIY